MFFVRTLILLSALLLGIVESKAGCEVVKITKNNLVKPGENGWTIVRVVLLYDWTKHHANTNPITYPFLIEMKKPAHSRADFDLWVKKITHCSNPVTKKADVQYTVEARRVEVSREGARYVWLETPLPLPADVVAEKASAYALVLGARYPGRWTTRFGEPTLVFERPSVGKSAN